MIAVLVLYGVHDDYSELIQFGVFCGRTVGFVFYLAMQLVIVFQWFVFLSVLDWEY